MINVHIQFDLQPIRPKGCVLQVVRISLLDQELFVYELPFQYIPAQNNFVTEEFEFPGYLVSEALMLRVECAFSCETTGELGHYCKYVGRFSKLQSTQQVPTSCGVYVTLLFAQRALVEQDARVLRIVPLSHNFEMKAAFQGQFVNYMDYLAIELQTPRFKIIYKWGPYCIFVEDCREVILKLVFAPFTRRLYESVSFYNLLLQTDACATELLRLEINVPHRQNYFVHEMSHLISLCEENVPYPEEENGFEVYFYNKYVEQQIHKIEYGEALDVEFNYPRFSTTKIRQEELAKPIAAFLGIRDEHVQSPSLPKGTILMYVQAGALRPSKRIFKSLSQREEIFEAANVIQVMPVVTKTLCDIIVATNNAQRIAEMFSAYNLQILDIQREESRLDDSSLLSYEPLQQRYKTVKIKNRLTDFDICVPTQSGGIDTLKSTVLSYFQIAGREQLGPDSELVFLLVKIVKEKLLVIDEVRLSYGSRNAVLIDSLFKTVQDTRKTKNGDKMVFQIKWKNQVLRDFHQQIRKWKSSSKRSEGIK